MWPSVAGAADGNDAGTVIIVFEPHAEAVSRRLRQEIEALGFHVDVELEADPEASLEGLALNAQAVAAIRVEPLAAGGVQMTVLDRATGKTVHRDLVRVTAAEPAGEELIATRTVELFRASLMELNADHPARGEVVAAPPIQALVSQQETEQLRQRSGAVFVAAGPALSMMPDWRPSVQFWLQASWISSGGFGLSAELFSPMSAARLSQPEGSVELRATSYRLGALWDFGGNEAAVSGRISSGWSLGTLSVQGTANTPFVGVQDDFVTWAPWLSASARFCITDHFALLAQGSGAVSLPRAAIRVAGRDVGEFAHPEFLASVGPELSWP